ncbi:2-dehydro-3-deoxy-6-phosphogalactonate aldolase [Sphingobium amiense]|uniref:2-dehydro-3-deoxy-6-phosphogalactonate aldolase n=1 Tax=Sphingobium amiense TaxID=135719 RepID=A0A494W2E0_9SPHN|nr:2-dehydro-3-deoxy-6-phosphogalactonate aldolase [Sphingobium amiense]BBD96757.1 2-dehydro-3-deoxy-6-phosphogalactonate aldolase [Sphingobium amiense]
MTLLHDFEAAFRACPLVAILRGVAPEEVESVGEALVGAGIGLIEIPLNSPRPLESIERLAGALRGRALVGAGTVLTLGNVRDVAAAGGQIIVSPNSDPAVIGATREAGLISLPGFSTPSEAFAALGAGATALKLFPAEAASPKILGAIRAVLPREVAVLPVGGIEVDSMAPWLAAGASGFGLGSSLYRPGRSAEEVGAKARTFVTTLASLRAAGTP